MKRLAITAVCIASFALGACTPEQEAKWASTVAAIKNGAKVAADASRAVVDEVCGYSPALVVTAQTSASVAIAQGKEWAARDINNALTALNAVCSSGGTSASSYANLAVRAWAAYRAVQAAEAAARG